VGANPLPSVALQSNFGAYQAQPCGRPISFYDALQVNLTKRVSHGFQFHVHTHGVRALIHSRPAADDSFPNGIFNQIFSTREPRADSPIRRSSNRCCQFLPGSCPVQLGEHHATFRQGSASVAFWSSQVGAGRMAAKAGLYKISTGQPFTPLLARPCWAETGRDQRPPDRSLARGARL